MVFLVCLQFSLLIKAGVLPSNDLMFLLAGFEMVASGRVNCCVFLVVVLGILSRHVIITDFQVASCLIFILTLHRILESEVKFYDS